MEEKRPGNFKRTLLLVALAAVLGGATLGGGLSVGVALMSFYTNRVTSVEPQSAIESETIRLTEANEPTIVPISVQAPNFRDMINNVKDSVVSINVIANVRNYFGMASVPAEGSGFIFSMDDENVYIATNNHVVESTEAISISLNDKDMVDARIIGRDEASDLAVIAVSKAELDEAGIPYKAAELGDSSQISMGDPVVAMGNAMGEGQTATSGMISSAGKTIEIDGLVLDVIQTDAAINQGNSGGPLFNAEGKVIGINTAKYGSSGVEGMGYSIPVNEAKEVLAALRDNGIIEKPFVGIQMLPQDIDENMADMFNLPVTGVMIESIFENGAAHKAGIQPMDIITAFNGETITTGAQLQALIAETKVGDVAEVELYRGEEKMTVEVEIGDMNDIQQ